MSKFIFKGYAFDNQTGEASFNYGFADGLNFTESANFALGGGFDRNVLDKALRLAFLVIGTSYLKTFPTREVEFKGLEIDEWQAEFLNKVYGEGLSQFAFENGLTRLDLPNFVANGQPEEGSSYDGDGVLTLQSGGKDSLLTAVMLNNSGIEFVPWYVASGDHHPKILDDLGYLLVTTRRTIDRDNLQKASENGGLNGHVPVTYIVQSLALIQAILLNKNQVLVSIAHEGEEPHATIGDLPVTHQWSKTWDAEQLFSEYVGKYVSPDIKIGSPLRRFSELKVAEMFVAEAWDKYGHRFSSCNRANYAQGSDNSELKWCGECPKCANSFVLFAPFVDAVELKSLFNGQDLFEKPILQETFKGLFGVDGVMKPFECVGEIDELRKAYEMAQLRGGYGRVSFEVPEGEFDYHAEYPSQSWAVI